MQNSSRPNLSEAKPACACHHRALNRRGFLAGAAAAVLALRARGAGQPDIVPAGDPLREPTIDIHVHCTHRARADEQIIVHQKNTGMKFSVLLPAGTTGGLAAGAAGNAHVVAFARRHPGQFHFFANENVFRPEAPREIERYLKQGAIGIGELKDNVACDSADMHRIAEVAREHDVPMLVHFQDGSYNDGFVRFHRLLEKFPTVKFIGHAQTFWANVDASYKASDGLYPKGPVAAGGLTDRWLADYPNFYGDLSAGSGNGALTRDVKFSQSFLLRHQDKLLYGSDCPCPSGLGPACSAAAKLKFIDEYSPSREVRRKLLFGNAQRLYRLRPSGVAL